MEKSVLHSTSPAERRKHQRFKTPEKTLAITSDVIGRIVDISAGGCEFIYINMNGKSVHEGTIDILLNDNGFYLEQIPFSAAWQGRPEISAFGAIITCKIGIRFEDLSPAQQQRIDYFISNYTLGKA